MGGGPERGLVHQPPAFLRRAVPGLVPARRRWGRRPRAPARRGRGSPAGGSVVRRPRRVLGGHARPARWVRRRSGRHGHLGDVLAHAADRGRVGGGRGPVRSCLPDGPSSAGARDHPDVVVLHGAEVAPRARCAPVDRCGHQRLRPGSRAQEDVEVQGQRRDADGAPRAARGRCRSVLGSQRPAWDRRGLRRAADQGGPAARDQAPERVPLRALARRAGSRGRRPARSLDARSPLRRRGRGDARTPGLRARESARVDRAVLLGFHRRLPRAREEPGVRDARARGRGVGDRLPPPCSVGVAPVVRPLPPVRDRGGLVLVAGRFDPPFHVAGGA